MSGSLTARWLLAALLAAGGWNVAAAVRIEWKSAAALASAQFGSHLQGIPLGPLSGVDDSGRARFLGPLRGTKHLAIFILRARSLNRDLDFWNAVATRLQGRRDTLLGAFCDGLACAHLLASAVHARPEFPVLVFGEPRTAAIVVHADQQGEFILATQNAIVAATPYWRQGAAPFQVAETIVRQP